MQIAPNRSHVLVLGGGDGLAIREILKYQDVQSVTVVDIDPEMTRLAREHELISRLNEGSLQNERVALVDNHALVDAGTREIFLRDRTKFGSGSANPVATVFRINMDAARFVEQVAGVYDVIVIDFPDPNNPELAKLYSRSFYHAVASKLSRFGIVVQQSTSPIHTKEAFLCIGRTMKSAGLAAIPYHDNVPTFGEWGWWIGGKIPHYTAQAIEEKLAGLEELDVPTRYLTNGLISAGLVFGRNQLESSFEDINTLMNNRIYAYYRRAVQLDR
jgi:spermidine synthase